MPSNKENKYNFNSSQIKGRGSKQKGNKNFYKFFCFDIVPFVDRTDNITDNRTLHNRKPSSV